MKRIILCSLTALATVQLNAQQQIHLSISSGVGKIGYLRSDEIYRTRKEDSYSHTFGINLKYSYGFKDFYIESGIAYNDLKGNQGEGRNITEITPDGFYRTVKNDIHVERKARYLSVPVTLNYRIEKLHIGAGVYTSALVSTSQIVTESFDDEPIARTGGKSPLNSIDFGLTAQVSYELSERASLLFSANYGTIYVKGNTSINYNTNELSYMIEQHRLKNRQFMVGLNFRLYKS